MHVCMKKYVYWVYGWFQDVQRRFCAGMLLHIGIVEAFRVLELEPKVSQRFGH